MDKKIGIMSMQRIINYGSFLQAYGLKKMIESISKSEVEFVDYRFGTDITDRLKRKQERTESVMDKVLKNRTPWNYLKKMQFFKEIERRLIQDLKAMGVDELNYDCRVDTLVIGSDEVFNCLQPYPVGYSKQLFGDGFEGNKLVSYAASFGSTRYEDLVETGIVQEIKTMLSKFAAISVRDENSAHIVKQLLGYDPEIHMDPVLMYDFAQEIAEYKTSEKDYIILYAYTGRLSREEECYIKKFANLGGRRMAYLVSALMSLAFIVVPMHGLIWGIDRVFKYIGFYAVGVFIAGKSVKAVRKKVEAGIVAIVLLALSFFLSCYHLTMGIMWFVTALIGVAAVILISQLINENRILQYFGRISLIILCIHGPVYRIVVKIVSILLNVGTDAVRENFLLAMVVVAITMAICSTAYEVVVRLAPWMVGKKKVKEN